MKSIKGASMPQTFSNPQAFSDKAYTPIPMTPVESNQIRAIGYDAASQTLACTFTRGAGAVYHYPGVSPELHAEFMASESKGNFFGERIKPLAFDKFPAPEVKHLPADDTEGGEA